MVSQSDITKAMASKGLERIDSCAAMSRQPLRMKHLFCAASCATHKRSADKSLSSTVRYTSWFVQLHVPMYATCMELLQTFDTPPQILGEGPQVKICTLYNSVINCHHTFGDTQGLSA